MPRVIANPIIAKRFTAWNILQPPAPIWSSRHSCAAQRSMKPGNNSATLDCAIALKQKSSSPKRKEKARAMNVVMNAAPKSQAARFSLDNLREMRKEDRRIVPECSKSTGVLGFIVKKKGPEET
ncbi:hypothetical protein GMOD_00002483 [Pyrenophora seminiperda CCB06]|uniref:Uncharacterized protein n=1 Tax=Pyrenophora seminiperda CCB06 TaxID=1302712 RepID=A0A3M7M2K5_9PLEO|nr:hypothetical protein GMOD_00002483 [Pyrenophora seminiperda CCB06]